MQIERKSDPPDNNPKFPDTVPGPQFPAADALTNPKSGLDIAVIQPDKHIKSTPWGNPARRHSASAQGLSLKDGDDLGREAVNIDYVNSSQRND